MPLTSIDLFSGTGALTLALRGIAEPVQYCDIDPDARTLLAHRQATGHLPRAPIHDDVLTLRPATVDMVVGGFPCVGFSPRGKREHFENGQSSLFFEMMRVVENSGAKAVFIENVPGVIAEIETIKTAFNRLGFWLRWNVVGADDVGAPHVRKRWFCLACKPSSPLLKLTLRVAGSDYTPCKWDPSTAPPRTRTLASKAEVCATDTRWALLGNGVVPDAVRLGFFRLFTAGKISHLHDNSLCVTFVHANAVSRATSSDRTGLRRCDIPHVDLSGHQIVLSSEPIATTTRYHHARLELMPSALPVPERPNANRSTPLIDAPVCLRHWSTPRHGMVRPCRVLTERSSRDLPTQIVFEKETLNRSAAVNADFGDWLMGLKPGYTCLEPSASRNDDKVDVPCQRHNNARTTVTLPFLASRDPSVRDLHFDSTLFPSGVVKG